MTTTWIKAAYAAAIGLLLAVTVAAGVAVFIAGPRPPQPLGLTFQQLSGNSTDAQTTHIAQQIDSFYSDASDFRKAYPNYQRDIFLWYAGLGILVAVIGTALPAVVNYLRVGFVLGGILLVGAGAWFSLQDIPSPISPNAGSILSLLQAGTPAVLDTAARFLRFAIAIVGLLVMLFVGLWRLTDWPSVPVRLVAVPVQPPASAETVAPLQTIPAAPSDPSDTTRWARREDEVKLAPFVSPEPAIQPAPPPIYHPPTQEPPAAPQGARSDEPG